MMIVPATTLDPDRPHASRRQGITLFEVLLSLVIFATAMSVLGQLAANGVRAALHSQLRTQAALRCQSKLAEVTTGIEPLAPVMDAPFPDDPGWSWSLRISASPQPALLVLEVSVSYKGGHSNRSVTMTMGRLLYKPRTVDFKGIAREFHTDAN